VQWLSIAGSLVQFHNMITATNNLTSWDFLGYGNHCGLGGSGPTLDDIDMCVNTAVRSNKK